MPRTKRNKIFSLTKTTAKTRAGKEALIEKAREHVNQFSSVYIFSVEHMRNSYMKEVRKIMHTSRFMFGSNKLLMKAIGDSPASACKDNMDKLCTYLVGDVGLMFTNESAEDVKQFFADFKREEYARSGTKASQTVELPAGALMRGEEPMPGNMDVHLRKLGMTIDRKAGQLVIEHPYTICKEGDILTTNQAHLLKTFWFKTATFSVRLICNWNNGELHMLEEQ